MSGGERTFIEACLTRAIALYIAQHTGRHYGTLFSDEADGPLDPEWEHMLAAPGLGGRAGVEIVAKRPRFRGNRIKQDLKSYARLLVDAGLVLGVCDWGFCVYREEHSACLGNAAGPNAARREPSTCSRCKNFAVSEQHRPYWTEQVCRSELLLNEPALPLQTLRIVRERLNEARSLIRAIDAGGNEETEHG